MKKLNITKEQFNKSRYFKNKYGKLAYVSESGRLFKTNKGKVLMFKEHHDPEGFTKNPEIQKLSQKVLSKMKRMRKMLDEWDVPSVSEKYKLGGNRIEITLKAGRDDSFSSIGGGRVLTIYVDTGLSGWRISITADEQITYPYLFRGEDDVIEVFNVFLNQFSRDFDDYIAELDRDEMDNAYTESKKFGKKFKESKGLEWLNSFKQAQDFVDKACEQLEVVAFEGGADVGNPIHKKLLRIWSEMRDVIESV